MKRMQFRLVALLLMGALLLGSMPGAMAAEAVQVDVDFYIPSMYANEIEEAALTEVWEDYTPRDMLADPQALTHAEAAELMRTALVNRDDYFQVIVDSGGYDKTTARQVYNLAIAHTGEPNEGDYIVYNGCHWSGATWSKYVNGKVCTVCEYTLYYYTTPEQEAEVDAAVDALLEELDLWEASDYEKLCGIYSYICKNIVYDYTSSGTQKYTAYAALINKTSVCQGYATLLYRLALELGLDIRFISGIGNGGGHGWNIVKLGSLYYNVDATWDAIWYQAIGQYGFFLQCTENFEDHARDAAFDTAEFHAAYPMSPVDYADMADCGSCGEGCYWTVTKDNRLIITGTGAMADYSAADAPWSAYAGKITALEIEEGITAIGSNAFAGCTAMTQAELPESLTAVGAAAFRDCQALQTVHYAGTAENWEAAALSGDNKPLYRCMAAYMRGDYDFDALVTNEDVVYLLWHSMYASEYPVQSDADFTADGQVTHEDVVYLLWHTLFPQVYPI